MGKWLPTELTKPASKLSDHSILIHSPPKFGKSTLLASIDDCIILATERGYKSQKAYVVYITSWQQALEVLTELESNKKFKYVGLDTADGLFNLCVEEICETNNKQHYTDIPWGKGKDLMISEFRRFIFRLMDLPMGVILTSHSQDVTIKARTGDYDKTIPTIHKFVRDIILGEVDIIMFGEVISKMNLQTKKRTEKRMLNTKVSTDHEAGDRTDRLDPEIELFKENGFAHIESIYNKNRDAESREDTKEAKKTEEVEVADTEADKQSEVKEAVANDNKASTKNKRWSKDK